MTFLPEQNSGRLPDFVIVGTQKGGTIALWENLNQHPQIHLAFDPDSATPREKHFFDHYWDKGIDWYRAQFAHPELTQGEKTPNYMADPRCPARMHAVIPQAKLICVLRNPVDRAYSSWNMFTQLPAAHPRHTKLLFEDFIEQYPQLLERGCYASQLQALLAYFPRTQLHLMISERLRAQPALPMQALHSFLDVDDFAGDWREHHVREYSSPLAASTRERLDAYYRDSNLWLRDYLNDPLPEWD